MKDWALDYIQHVLEAKDWNAADLARHAGLAHSTINRPLTVKDWPTAISRQTITKVYHASGIDPSPFAPKGDIIPVPPPDADLVPVYNVAASAGYGALIGTEEIVDKLAFPPGYLRRITSANQKNLAIIGVKGDSMIPTLKDDDVVMVDMSKTDLSFEGLFVLRDGGDSLLVKRISRGPRRGTVLLVSDNRAYPQMERDVADVDVVGKVVWMGVKV